MGETALDASRWRDRVALVTGGSSGIGRAVVAALIGAGMRVATCARRSESVDALRAELGHAVDARLLTIPADLAQPAHVQIHDILMRPTAQAS